MGGRTYGGGCQLLTQQPECFRSDIRAIIQKGHDFSAVDAYNAEYLKQDLSRKIQIDLSQFDALIGPTSPTIHTPCQMEQSPISLNSEFGTYTNFTNLADLSALALPAGFRTDGLPFGISLIAPAWMTKP